ncbi:hypothetical protein GOP47_0007056 [Adiantum capillus-veneris]|uniref:Uncharacterized protein n=1 Tax=Adiantum capillus-veneris TaxID=13818 RepID=A0A9D4V1E4_ADICA|nr:hypothetical protein GOP47_0007056 [Adiantum capillus-veneris]
MLQLSCCRPSLLIRWLLLLLLPCVGFAWAIGFSAVNAIQANSLAKQSSLRQRSLFVSLGGQSVNCSGSSQPTLSEQLSVVHMIQAKLRGWRYLSRSDQQSAQQSLQLRKLRGHACQSSTLSRIPPSYTSTFSVPLAAHAPHQSPRRRLNGCTDRDISISQSRDMLAGGVPQYVVQIYNTCMVGGCAPSAVHVKCGWFASKVVVNPGIFRRLAYDDCLVNAGRPILRGQILRFTYQNSFMYPLSFKSAQFC